MVPDGVGWDDGDGCRSTALDGAVGMVATLVVDVAGVPTGSVGVPYRQRRGPERYAGLVDKRNGVYGVGNGVGLTVLAVGPGNQGKHAAPE